MLGVVLEISGAFFGLGAVGMERLTVYSKPAFVIGLGGHLMGTEGRLRSSR